MHSELGAEVGDWRGAVFRMGYIEPAGSVAHLGMEAGHHLVIPLQVARIAGASGYARWLDLAQQLKRTVTCLVPQDFVEILEQGPDVAVPAPCEIGGEFAKAFDASGEVRDCRHSVRLKVGRKA